MGLPYGHCGCSDFRVGFLLLDMIDLKRAELAIHEVGNSDRIKSSLYLVCIVETWDLGKLLPSLDQIVDVIDSLYTLLLLPLSSIQSFFALLLIFLLYMLQFFPCQWVAAIVDYYIDY